jgi:YVTN family beta-propeller protein
MFARAALIAILIMAPACVQARAVGPPLALEAKIPLGKVSGRIDHLAVDLKRQRLFVAELGNNSLGVVDLNTKKVLRTVTGLREPQGVGYEPSTDTVYVANAGDGSVHVLHGEDLSPAGRIALGDDADNVRIDAQRHRVLVGFGKGSIAVIDPVHQTKVDEIRLKGHPESFQLDETGTEIFVNVPDAGRIQIIDLASRNGDLALHIKGMNGNFPMAIDPEARRVLVVFRDPPRFMAISSQDGSVAALLKTCRDADDLFVDTRRHRVYVSCGAGLIDVLERREGRYAPLAQVPTVSGARTSLFVPELDRLFVAVRARGNEPAAIWVFRPAP